ncbi:MAG: Ribosome maturation factor RimP [Gammaproteobacteria bacterium]|nr:Ribosome maturation factor RimP [Gammaproteobacteria bacterium]
METFGPRLVRGFLFRGRFELPRGSFFVVAGVRREAAVTTTVLQELLAPGAEALGFEVLAVELSGTPGRSVVRVYIDGANGVTVDDCARASHQFSAILDVEDPIPGKYALEVSSPGLDRPLSKAKHFRAAVGQEIRLKTDVAVNGRRRFRGRLDDAGVECLELIVDGETYRIPLSRVVKARVVPE